ncbi:hypothetical protein CEP51_011607 [Fusarium floridanum]|uniref:Signal recognition particle SRP54 helical bundle domain-containing protein n=1 Tax=Fusarium floridanum TaxID=1325733 RepID=A0A428R9X3_9HYPO|nr:hypothetical protein CEP51_011607 [Fusarium floridanum]
MLSPLLHNVVAPGGLFRNIVEGEILTKKDLDAAMDRMENHLLKKNVARETAVRLCESVEKELLGVKTGNFESINTRIQSLAISQSSQRVCY